MFPLVVSTNTAGAPPKYRCVGAKSVPAAKPHPFAQACAPSVFWVYVGHCRLDSPITSSRPSTAAVVQWALSRLFLRAGDEL